MRIRTAEAERIDAHERRAGHGGQRRHLLRHLNAQALKVDRRIELLKKNVGRHLMLAQHGDRLCDAGHAGAGFEVAEIGLDGSDEQRRFALLMAEHLADAFCFDRVACGRAGAVRFDISNTAAVDGRIFIDGLQKPLLRFPVRKRNAVGAAVRIDARGANNGMNRIAVAHRRVERLDQNDSAAFGAHVAVPFGVEHLAAAVLRKHVRFREADEGHGRKQHVDAAHDRHRQILFGHGAAGFMERHEARGACRIDRHARAVQIEEVAQTVGDDGERRPRHAVRPRHREIVGMDHAHVGRRRADIDRRIAPRHARRPDAGVFKRLPGHLQHHALLRIERLGFLRTHREEGRVELLHVADDARRRRAGLARCLTIRMPVAAHAEALFRDIGNYVRPL